MWGVKDSLHQSLQLIQDSRDMEMKFLCSFFTIWIFPPTMSYDFENIGYYFYFPECSCTFMYLSGGKGYICNNIKRMAFWRDSVPLLVLVNWGNCNIWVCPWTHLKNFVQTMSFWHKRVVMIKYMWYSKVVTISRFTLIWRNWDMLLLTLEKCWPLKYF